jgi:endo-1,4-beta-xylanase
LNLNFEFANSRVVRNRKRLSQFENAKWKPTYELKTYHNLSEEFLNDAEKNYTDTVKCAHLAQKSLMYALWASEMMEIEKANSDILKIGKRDGFFFGCDARAFYQMDQDLFLDLFSEVFNYANITFVVERDGIMSHYQSSPGVINPETREILIRKLNKKNIKCQERLLFWFHNCCTPDWIRNMKYDDLLKYAEKLTYDTMKYFGDILYAMEVVNEIHDWANELHLNKDQITELTRLINDVAKSVAPNVKRTVNNCCPFAEYVHMKQYSKKNQEALLTQRTPYQFSKDLIDAGIDFDILEQQMYFPYRDIQDSVMMMEKLGSLGKPMQISEIGADGGPTNESIKTGQTTMPKEPYHWHRPWDEETQADWIEDAYTVYYSKPFIQAINWFDFIDFRAYQENGGILRTLRGEKKESFHRLKKLQNRFNSLPIK